MVDRYFDSASAYWREVYHGRELQAHVYRRRMEAALSWVDELGLAPGARVLEVGCGAGLLSRELGARGLAVTATDSSPEMVELVRRAVGQERLGTGLHVQRADVHRLPFDPGEFELVIALGLLPWLHDPQGAVEQMARVLVPGGRMILTADNRRRLNFLLEPRENVLLTPLRTAFRALKRATGRRASGAPSHLHRPAEVDRMLLAAGMRPVHRATVGFGPFTFLGRPLLRDQAAFGLHRRLQEASRRRPALRRFGWHYLVEARKSGH